METVTDCTGDAFVLDDELAGSDESRSADALLPLVYDQLHEIAARWFGRQPRDHTLQPTALVHEAYVRLASANDCAGRWNDRAHFFRVAARAMRQVLVDYARRRGAAKRGHAWQRVTLSEATDGSAAHRVDLLALNDALERLAALNERQCRIVELRFLAGMSVEETAAILGVSPRTVKFDWRMARAWLLRELSPEEDE
jgi:RNA polymerase sigma factor (TIGR02999 family)